MTTKAIERSDEAVPAAPEEDPEESVWLDELTPRQIVAELDKYIVGQDDAKRSVAIVLRNRWRRQRVDDEMREEIAPKWAPDQQPWLLQEADRQVFDILLAVIPKELFEETAAYQDIQDLRKGDQIFTLRAADKLTEAARRGK